MKKSKMKLKTKVYPVIWSGIIVVSIYLIVRFAALSFSDHVGQADLSIKDALISKLCQEVLEAGSSYVAYSASGQEQYPFIVKLAADQLAVQKFTKDNSVLAAKAQTYSYPLPGNAGDTGEESVQTMAEVDNHTNPGFYDISGGSLSTEYILTNGAVYNSSLAGEPLGGLSGSGMTEEKVDELQIGYTQGNIYFEDENAAPTDAASMETAALSGTKYTLEQLKNINFLVRNFYIVDKSTKVTDQLFDAGEMLSKDMKIKQTNDAPQILIYHTHSHEAYADSRADKKEDSVVGVGEYLTDILKKQYGYNVIHDTSAYDEKDGMLDRNVAYNNAEDGLKRILSKYPTIEVVIDLHRDEGSARVSAVDGKETAKIMLFNGLCRDQNGPITSLNNPYLQDNLAFSLQMQLKSLDLYPGLFIKNYLKSYRFNMHVRPKCLLVELGTVNNTLQSAKNAMEPFARVLDAVLHSK